MALWTNVDNEAGKPKYLNSTDKAATLGINADETANQKATHAGWVLSTSGSGGRAGRVFNETLVAMGSMTGDNDTVNPDPVITIGTEPDDVSVTSPADGTFTVVATNDRGATLSYQWSYTPDAGATWIDISGATSASLTVESTDSWYVDGNDFKVIVSAPGATPVESSPATLTVA